MRDSIQETQEIESLFCDKKGLYIDSIPSLCDNINVMIILKERYYYGKST